MVQVAAKMRKSTRDVIGRRLGDGFEDMGN